MKKKRERKKTIIHPVSQEMFSENIKSTLNDNHGNQLCYPMCKMPFYLKS